MAIAFDSSAAGTGSSTISGTQGINWNHTCAGTGGRMLCIFIIAGSELTLTSVTYNSVEASLVTSQAQGSFVGYMYVLGSPSTGTNTVSVVASGGTGVSHLSGCSSSYSGTDTTDGSSKTSTAGATSLSHTLTTTRDNDWLVSGIYGGTTITASTNTTKRNGNETVDKVAIGDSNAAETPAGSFTQAYTWTGSTAGILIIVGLATPNVVSITDTVTLTDTETAIPNHNLSLTDTVTSTDSKSVKYGWNNEQKSSAPTWVNEQKS